MKTNLARTLLFSSIAMMSLFLLGSADHNQVANQENKAKQLQEIAFDFQDIPIANRTAWNSAIIDNPELLIRLSTSKLVGIADKGSISR
ncbi:MAG: hypothetical protein L3J71_01385 [Victivallaceae bacterium]|nr:hypothetical protein [Victivallaceae bacterium]